MNCSPQIKGLIAAFLTILLKAICKLLAIGIVDEDLGALSLLAEANKELEE